LLETSVVVDRGKMSLDQLPTVMAISTLTLAELAGGPHGADHELESSRRRRHLQDVEANFEAVPFDSGCAHAYGHIYAAVGAIGRKPRGARMVDLMIAATALAHDLPLYTRNAKDLRGLENLIEIVMC
jgi:predicted nucleic acid-binding protein